MKKQKSESQIQYAISPYSIGRVTGAIFFDTRRILQDQTYPIKYRVTFGGKHKYFNTGFSLSLENWKALPRTKGKQLMETRDLLTNGNAVIKEHVKELVKENKFAFEALEARLKKGDSTSVDVAFTKKIETLEKNGQVGTAGIYDSALKSLSDFNKYREIRFTSITRDWLEKYERWFVGDDKNSYATASIYLRCLRAIFNDSIRDGVVSSTLYPFGRGKYEIPSSPGRKLALSLPQIKTLIEYPVEAGSTTEKMRDLWIFIYLANGMNIKDLITLKWRNITDGEITYYREKTKNTSREKRHIVVPVMKEMEIIIEKWANRDQLPDSYIFGYLDNKNNSPERVRVVAQNVTRLMNRYMKKIASATGIPSISTYTARHSFSTILLRSGANIEFISESLGHASITTTKAYLAGFETEARRKMNTNLLNFTENDSE